MVRSTPTPSLLARPAGAARSYRVGWLGRLPYPLRTAARRWRGMIGMVVGVGIALSLAMTMLAITNASNDLVLGDFINSGTDLYVVTEGGTLIPMLPGDTPGTIKQARRVLTQVRALPEVDAAVGVMSAVLERERDGPRRSGTVAELLSSMGVDGDPQAMAGIVVLRQGRWLRRSDEIVIGERLSREKNLAVGDPLRLSGRVFTVVGIGHLRGLGFGTDSLLYLDYAAFRERAVIGDVMTTILIETPSPANARARLAEIGGLSASDPAELIARVQQAQASSIAVNWIVSLLALAIGALFVSSMLGRSVIERRLEFATLKALGLPNRTILQVVALEAITISLVATLVGIGISRVFGVLIDVYIAAPYGIASLYKVDLASVLTVLVLALGLGLVAGLVPARQATRVDPVEILREA